MPPTKLLRAGIRTAAPLLAAAGFTAAGSPAMAQNVIRITEAAFLPAAGLITFSEPGFPLNTVNPTYTFADYGGVAGQPTVTFDGFFLGQSLSVNPGVDCPGANANGCVVGSPSSPLSLDPAAPNTFITTDGANPTSPVLSGNPRFNGPIGILFDTDVVGVGLDAGFFDAVGGTAIKVYDRAGNLLGSTANLGTGIEFLGLVTDDGSASIAGLEFSLVGGEPAGYAIDNVRFARRGEIIVPGAQAVPGPLPVVGASVAFGFSRRLRQRIRLVRQA